MKIGRVISFIMVGFIMIYLLFFNGIEKRLSKHYSELEYRGRIVDKFIDKENHSYRIIILNNQQRVSLPPTAYFLFPQIEVGDTIYKESSTLFGYIKNGDKKLVIDYNKAIPSEE